MTKLKWGTTYIKGINKKVKTAEETNDWAWWGMFVVCVLMAVAFILKLK